MQQDVIIVGGGMVGAAAAVGFAKLGLKVAVLEKQPLPTFDAGSNYDLRISAISVTSIALLEKLGAWQAITAMRTCPYQGLETWEIDGFDTRFHAQEIGLEKLGDMVENNVIQLALWQQLQGLENVSQAVGFRQISANYENGIWQVSADEQSFSAPLLIAADGANSLVRKWANIGLTSWQYRQHCLLATVETELPQQAVTWQQFFTTGPRAFLPLQGHHGCVVWYDSPQRIAQLKNLPLARLSEEIQSHFPARLGKVSVQKVGSFPLTRQHAQQYVKQGVALLGDAAHTINPLAGQGVNLGFKDVAALLDVVEQAVRKGEDFAQLAVLKRYENARRADNLLMQTGMDVFYKAFKTELLPLKMVRNFGLIVAQRCSPLKQRALKYAIGL